MRIGLLTSYLALGENADSGIGQHYHILADALAEQGHRVHVVHPTLKPDAARTALAALSPKWTCDIVPVRPSSSLDRLLRRSWPSRVLMAELCTARAADKALVKAVEKHGLEIIETHATGSPALLYLGRTERPPVLTRVSTTMSQMNATSNIHSRVKGWQGAIERFTVRSSDALVTHTRKHRDAICAIDGYSPDHFAIVAHGLPDIALPQSEAAPNNLTPEILFVGRFEHRKGIDVLLEAIPTVLATCPNARFTLAGSLGDGVEWEKFTRRHPALAGERVIALGGVSTAELNALYARCDILVAPSRYESFGLIYVEAMRYSKPVIGCDAGGIPEVVTDGVTGLLAKPGDAASLSACIVRLIKDHALRLRLGQSGREHFVRRFSATQMAANSALLYACILDSGQRPSI